MKQAREIDKLMAEQVLGHKLFHEKSGAVREQLTTGQSRPLRSYSLDISAAWEVVEKLGMTIIPVEGGYFALVGERAEGWESPAAFINYVQKGDFVTGGAAVSATAPMSICLAAMKSLERKKNEAPAAAGASDSAAAPGSAGAPNMTIVH